MEINATKLLTTERSTILAHIMLEDKEKASLIADTLTGLKGDERVVDVVVLFNGIPVDGKVVEDWLQYQIKHIENTYKEKYDDVEKEISKRVEKIKSDLTYDFRSETIEKIQKLREHLDRIELDLDCLSI
jgi:hypothetical protein